MSQEEGRSEDFNAQKFMDQAQGVTEELEGQDAGDPGSEEGAAAGTDKPEEKPEAGGGAPDQGGAGQQAQELDDYFSALSETVQVSDEVLQTVKNGRDGKPLSKAEKLELLKDTILDNVQFGNDPRIDNFVRKTLAASSQENFNLKEFLAPYANAPDTAKMSDRDFMKMYYQEYAKRNKIEDITDDEIEKDLDKMTRIQLATERRKAQQEFNSWQEEDTASFIGQTREQFEQNIQNELSSSNKLIEESILPLMDKVREKKTIGGFEFGDAERKELLDGLPEFTKKKVVQINDGQKAVMSEADKVLTDVLSKPESAFNLLVYLHMVKTGKIEGYSSTMKENIKRQVEESIDDSQESQMGKGAARAGTFDANEFMRKAQG